MATYNSYPGVRKLQAYLEANKNVVGFTRSLKDADGTFDGKYGPDTDEAFWAWLAELPEGSDLSSLVPHVLSPAEAAQVAKAQAEFNESLSKPPVETEPGTDIPLMPKKAGLGTAAWVLIGAGVVIAGGLGFYFLTRRSTRALGCGCGR
jgi:hypothetical protein